VSSAPPGPRPRHADNLTLLDREWLTILAPLLGSRGLALSRSLRLQRLLPGDDYNERWLDALGLVEEARWRIGCVFVLHRRAWTWPATCTGSSATCATTDLSLRVNPLLPVGLARACDRDLLLQRATTGASWWTWPACGWPTRGLVVAPLVEMFDGWHGLSARQSCDRAGVAVAPPPTSAWTRRQRLQLRPGRRCRRRAVRQHSPRCLAACLDHPARKQMLQRDRLLSPARAGRGAQWRLCHGGCMYEGHGSPEASAHQNVLCEDYRLFVAWRRAEYPPGCDDPALTMSEAQPDVSAPIARWSRSLPPRRRGPLRRSAPRLRGHLHPALPLADWPAADLLKLLDFFLYAHECNAIIERSSPPLASRA